MDLPEMICLLARFVNCQYISLKRLEYHLERLFQHFVVVFCQTTTIFSQAQVEVSWLACAAYLHSAQVAVT